MLLAPSTLELRFVREYANLWNPDAEHVLTIRARLLYAIATNSCSGAAILKRRHYKTNTFLIPEDERAPATMENVADSDFVKM